MTLYDVEVRDDTEWKLHRTFSSRDLAEAEGLKLVYEDLLPVANVRVLESFAFFNPVGDYHDH